MAKMKIKVGDKVVVLTGKDKGAEGEVIISYPQKQRVSVQGVNTIKKTMRPTQANPQGGIMSIEAPIHVSNVALICPHCDSKPRVGVVVEEGKKYRKCKKCGKSI